jgi:hypothetical protein
VRKSPIPTGVTEVSPRFQLGNFGLGLDYDLFWRLTPRLILLSLQAAQQSQINQHNELVYSAYLTEALHRTKRLPKIETLFAKPQHRQHQRQTLDQQRSALRAIAAAFGTTKQLAPPRSKAVRMTPEEFAERFKR